MSDASKQQDWTKPAAMAIPKGGFFKDKVEQGRYGPIFPKSPACYGFTIIAKIKPGREEVIGIAVQRLPPGVPANPRPNSVCALRLPLGERAFLRR